jgi:branched-chain amino acid transport system ATP-binding protein
MLLEMKDAVLSYGKIEALHGISVQVAEGEVVSLIGANGAGKTSTMRALSGVRGLSSGSVVFDGQDVTKMRADQRLRKGLVLCPEGRGIFPGMTVTENLNMGAYTRKDKAAMDEDYDRVFGLFPRLLERKKQVAGTMSGGEQQMLAIGRSLMSRPKLLMLDEPSMGLAPTITDLIFERIAVIRTQLELTILMVEQRVVEALQACDHGYVLETGRVALSGSRDQLMANDRVRQAYLGI